MDIKQVEIIGEYGLYKNIIFLQDNLIKAGLIIIFNNKKDKKEEK